MASKSYTLLEYLVSLENKVKDLKKVVDNYDGVELGEINNQINNLQNQINTLKEQMENSNTPNEEIVMLQNKIDILQNQINNLQNQITNLENQIGNSNGGNNNPSTTVEINNDISKINNILGITYGVNVTWQEGYWRIKSDNTKLDLSNAAGKSKISNPIKLNAGDFVKIKTNDYNSSCAMVLTDENESFYQGLMMATGTMQEFTYTVEVDTYMIFGTKDAEKDNFEIEVIPSKSKEITNIKNTLKNIENNSFVGVENGGELKTVTDSRTNKTTSIELVFSINSADKIKWFYGATSTNMFAVYHNGNSIRVSLNVGEYEVVDVPYKMNEICHVVIVFDNEEKSKATYVNGEFIDKKINASMANQTLNDIFNLSTNVTVYQKRIWDRALNISDVKLLYNYGFPTKCILNESIKNKMISELVSCNLNNEFWLDSATNKNISLNSSKVLIEKDTLSVHKNLKELKDYIYKNDSVFNEVIHPDFRIHWTNRGSHDCTFIDGKLVSFNKPSDGNAFILNGKTLTKEKEIKINFIEPNTRELEMKSTDYKFNKLIVGNGRAIKYNETSYEEQGSKLYVFHEAKNWLEYDSTTEINFDNCGEYDKIDISDLGFKVYGFWGNFDDCVFVSCNLFEDIYLIQLAKGSNQYANGNYVEATETRYNGSYRILNHWHLGSELNPNSGHGGQFYKGSLYIAPNTLDECRVYKYKLLNNGNIKLDILNYEVKDEQGRPAYHYIDGICIKDNVLYAQPLCIHGSYAVVTNFLLVSDI